MKGTSEGGTGRGMDGARERGREEASGGGIGRGREGAREQAREAHIKAGIMRRALASIQYIHKPSHNAAFTLETLVIQIKHCERV